MSAKVIVLTSSLPGAGKTHFAAGMACWLKEHGHHSAPLQLSPPTGDLVSCPEGGFISRATALLAEASGLMPDPVYESGWKALTELRDRFDTVYVEAASATPVPGEWPTLHLSRENGKIRPSGLAELDEFQPDLMPNYGPEIAALPLWRLPSAPRCAVITLPHIDNFADYQLLRGSEWLTTPGVGRYSNLFLPRTTNIASDLEWMEMTGLAAWISTQCATGSTLSVCGWDYPDAERCEPGDLLDFRQLSPLLGRRVPPSLPDEAMREQLADWFGRWRSIDEFTHTFLK